MSLFGYHRDDRRRRVLAEELSGDRPTTADAAPKPGGKNEKIQRYTASARRENHGRMTDILPRSMLPLALWYILGLVLAAGLLFGFISFKTSEIATSGKVADLLDASKGGSLAGWFSSMAFILSAVISVLIYSVRRHKLDDYRGRYRLWLWCAAAWIVMSIDATANLHTPFSRAMAGATGWSMLPGGSAWWIGIWGVILAILSLRLLLEMRECRLAMLSVVTVDLLWITALATDYGWMPRSLINGAQTQLVAIGCRLAAQVTLLMAIGWYARYVLLDAEDLLKARPEKPKREKVATKAKTEKSQASSSSVKNDVAAPSTRIDAGHRSATVSGNFGNSGSASGSNTSTRFTGYEDDEDEDERSTKGHSRHRRQDDEQSDDDDAYGDGNRKLSKAERKRLRKQMRRQQREDES